MSAMPQAVAPQRLVAAADMLRAMFPDVGFVLIVTELKKNNGACNYISNVQPPSVALLCRATVQQVAKSNGRLIRTEEGHA